MAQQNVSNFKDTLSLITWFEEFSLVEDLIDYSLLVTLIYARMLRVSIGGNVQVLSSIKSLIY